LWHFDNWISFCFSIKWWKFTYWIKQFWCIKMHVKIILFASTFCAKKWLRGPPYTNSSTHGINHPNRTITQFHLKPPYKLKKITPARLACLCFPWRNWKGTPRRIIFLIVFKKASSIFFLHQLKQTSDQKTWLSKIKLV